MNKTGMFLPKKIEKTITPSSGVGKAVFAVGIAALVLGSAFLLRTYTINHFTLWTKAPNVTGIAILPEDGFKMDHRMADILALKEVQDRMEATNTISSTSSRRTTSCRA